MTNSYSGMMPSLKHLEDRLLQVSVYNDAEGKAAAVIILDEDPEMWIQTMQELAKYIKKHRLSMPLIINRSFIQSSLDSYPLEFLNIISSVRHDLFLKEDMLSALKFNSADVRLQMEREFKSKWLLTRQVILEGNLKSRQLADTMHLSIRSLIPAIKGFFLLAGQNIPQTSKDIFEQAALICKLDLSVMHHWQKTSNIELADVQRYLAILTKLMAKMETYAVTI